MLWQCNGLFWKGKTMATQFHYGVHVSSETPVGGVIAVNSVPNLLEEIYEGIDLGYIEHCKECDNDEHDICYEGQGITLVGDWKLNKADKYEPDHNGPEGYAAIVGEIYAQVVYSKHFKNCALCSPCYPGQGDLDSEGEYKTFDFPPEMYQE